MEILRTQTEQIDQRALALNNLNIQTQLEGANGGEYIYDPDQRTEYLSPRLTVTAQAAFTESGEFIGEHHFVTKVESDIGTFSSSIKGIERWQDGIGYTRTYQPDFSTMDFVPTIGTKSREIHMTEQEQRVERIAHIDSMFAEVLIEFIAENILEKITEIEEIS